tara:strand:+ start:31955 stop:34564 length:2610 start_codon:yes stop_codon:yes gene_type:complete
MSFFKDYLLHVEERKNLSVPPLPLTANQVDDIIALLPHSEGKEADFLLELLTDRVPPGVDDAAYVKAGFLSAIALNEIQSSVIERKLAIKLLGTMLGGYNIQPLVRLLDDNSYGYLAADQLKDTLLMFDAFYDVEQKAKCGNENAKEVLASWADAEWFLKKPDLMSEIKLKVFKVIGETNTDDLSPAQDAWSRPDIPLHAQAILKMSREGILPDKEGEIGPISKLTALKEGGLPIAYVGDVVGTGSSRKSATNSVLWHIGKDIPFVPNKRLGGVVIGGKIAPIFFNTVEDSGALPIECPVDKISMGDVITVKPYEGIIENENGTLISEFKLKTDTLLDEVKAGGRIPLIIGRSLTFKARDSLKLKNSKVFKIPASPKKSKKGFTLAQKMVGKACGVEGIRPGTYCEPRMSTVGSQDTTGPMTRDELKELACLGFSSDFVLQSFCHTAAYPKPVDVKTQHTLPDFIKTRGGVSLRPGDGVIHSWLNRMLLPDQVGTGGDSHTRFPLGISFPAGSGLVAFGAALGVIPLDMPESVLVKFTGKMQPGITLRDLVNAIPYEAKNRGLLTLDKKGKKNIYNGKILEIQGLPDLTVEQAFELSDASAERSAGGCTIQLSEKSIMDYLKSNIVMLRWMIDQKYEDARTLERRAQAMEEWIKNPHLLKADHDAEYAEIIEIDITKITEPLLACPNDPDDVRPLSEVSGRQIDEVFIGSCMTNIGHFRAAGKLLEKAAKSIPTRLWIAPPTKMDKQQLMLEGYYNIFAEAGARMEMPGCSLCMGNQARIAENSTAVSTSTRNFPNRLGKGADVFLASAELAAVAAILGRIPTIEEYRKFATSIDIMAPEIYSYLNFDRIPDFVDSAKKAEEVIVKLAI